MPVSAQIRRRLEVSPDVRLLGLGFVQLNFQLQAAAGIPPRSHGGRDSQSRVHLDRQELSDLGREPAEVVPTMSKEEHVAIDDRCIIARDVQLGALG